MGVIPKPDETVVICESVDSTEQTNRQLLPFVSNRRWLSNGEISNKRFLFTDIHVRLCWDWFKSAGCGHDFDKQLIGCINVGNLNLDNISNVFKLFDLKWCKWGDKQKNKRK